MTCRPRIRAKNIDIHVTLTVNYSFFFSNAYNTILKIVIKGKQLVQPFGDVTFIPEVDMYVWKISGGSDVWQCLHFILQQYCMHIVNISTYFNAAA